MSVPIKTIHLNEAVAFARAESERGEDATNVLRMLDGRYLTRDQARRVFAPWDVVEPDGPEGADVTYYSFRLHAMEDHLCEMTDGTFLVDASQTWHYESDDSDDDDSDDDSDENSAY